MSSNIAKTELHNNVKKVALITGSSTGIGANIAIDLAIAGYEVVITGRDLEKLNEVVEQCKLVSNSSETSMVAFVADLSEMDQVDRLVDFVRLKFNRLNVLINNVCYRGNVKSIIEEGSYEDLEKVMHLNLFVPLYLSKKCLLLLRNSSFGKAIIICITSTASQVVVPLHLYSISKACLAELSKQMALSTDILSFSIAPGPILTKERPFHTELEKLTLMKRVGTTQEVSDLVMFSIEHAQLFNGKETLVDGGYIARSASNRSNSSTLGRFR